MRVQALTRGYYGDRIVDEGVEFQLRDPSHYSPSWMLALDGEPEKNATEKVKKAAVKSSRAKPATPANFA
jgi:hypothetical protein